MTELSGKDRAALMALGFQPLEASPLTRMLVSVEASGKCGKTHWALGAPDPVAYFNFDTGLEGIDQKFLDKDIMVFDFPAAPTIDTQEEAKQIKEQFLAAYKLALGKAKTIVVDTGSECWEVYRLAEFGKLTQVRSHHYSAVNMAFKRLWRMAYETPGQNLIMVHKLKAVYSGESRTGELERAGFQDTEYDAQVIVRLHRETAEEPGGMPDFGLTIEECRLKPQLTGRELPMVMNNWDMLQSLVIGE